MSIIAKAFNKGFTILEMFFSKNWFNPFATIWVNFRSLPFSEALLLPVWVYGRPRLMTLCGKFRIDGKIESGMIRFNYVNLGSPSNMGVQSELNNSGTIVFKGSAKIRTGNRIVVGYGGVLEFGDKVIMGDMINIGCFKSIKIGDNVRIAHRSQIFDCNYHYVANFNKKIVPPITRPVEIGSHCWICNTSSISAGTKLPPYTIVSTNSLVNKNFSEIPEKSIIGGVPAKLIASGFQLVNNLNKEMEISRYYSTNCESIFPLPEDIDMEDWFNQM